LKPEFENNEYISLNDGVYTAKVDEFELHSAFQPIVSLIHHRPVGYEGLIRPYHNGESISPEKLFKALAGNAFASELDRICRTLHLLNGSLSIGAHAHGWLFLNIDERSIQEDFYSPKEVVKGLKSMGFNPQNLVLEILEKNIEDQDRLANFVQHYKEVGFKIALDDFGAGESNLERIHAIRPSIVKLDRSIIQDLASGYNGVNILKRVISLIREMGSMVLVEGVETEEQALLVMETEADLVQGFYFSKPVIGKPPEDQGEAKRQIKKLSLLQKSVSRKRMDYRDRLENELKGVFELAVEQGSSGESAIAKQLFQHKHILRFFTLDHQGYQVGHTFSNPNIKHTDTQYHPLKKDDGACWTRRDFFFEAIRKPGEIYISSPYLSLPEETLSVTISSTFQDKNGRLRILCVDVDANAMHKRTSKAVRRLTSNTRVAAKKAKQQ